jgi:hypothetical protein
MIVKGAATRQSRAISISAFVVYVHRYWILMNSNISSDIFFRLPASEGGVGAGSGVGAGTLITTSI